MQEIVITLEEFRKIVDPMFEAMSEIYRQTKIKPNFLPNQILKDLSVSLRATREMLERFFEEEPV